MKYKPSMSGQNDVSTSFKNTSLRFTFERGAQKLL